MSFGYSVGDVISGANLTYRLIRIMADTEGGSDEYVEAMSELAAMQQAFLQISEIRNHKLLPPATVNAASHIVLSSMDTIAKFLERTKQYQRRLEDPRTSTFQSSWHKIGWTLYKSHELHSLRDALHSRLTSVQVLLSAASYCTPLPAAVAQYQAADQNSHTPSTAEPSPTPPPPPKGGGIHDRVADMAENKQKGSNSPPPSPEHSDRAFQTSEGNNIRQFIYFKDAIGRKFKFPWEKSRTWAEIEDLIKQAFVQVDVLVPYVMAGNYDLVGPDGKIILPSVWEDIVEPDLNIIMAMWPMSEHDEQPTSSKVPPPRPQPAVESNRNQGIRQVPPGWERSSDPPVGPHPMDDKVRVTSIMNPPLNSFEDALRALQAERPSQQIGHERHSRQDSSHEGSPMPSYLRKVLGNFKEYRHERLEERETSVKGEDHESVAPTSASDDWEDDTDDGETLTEDEEDNEDEKIEGSEEDEEDEEDREDNQDS
ncbi:hypothetical protein FCOIX_7925 [Fusarium coicis]|nr:hypothetical protein FCOIX_7925 [Fusarium coicis]